MLTPETRRAEAEAMERLAAVVSYAPDKQRLTLRAAELRALAQAQAQSPAPAGAAAERRA